VLEEQTLFLVELEVKSRHFSDVSQECKERFALALADFPLDKAATVSALRTIRANANLCEILEEQLY